MKIGDRVLVTRGNHAGVLGVITAFHGVGSGQQAEIQLGFEKTNCTFGVFIKDIRVLANEEQLGVEK
jgi:hypothetical protein